MRRALLVSAVVLAVIGCTRSPAPAQSSAEASGSMDPAARASAVRQPAVSGSRSASLPDAPSMILYYPSRERVLEASDDSGSDIHWQPLGLTFPSLLRATHRLLVLEDTALTDRDGNSKGILVAAGTQASLQEAGDWTDEGSGWQRRYRIRGTDPRINGWIDAGSAALLLAEKDGLRVGLLPRQIEIGGGLSEYSLLVLVDRGTVTEVDTSYYPFPDDFHPSGVLSVSLSDLDGDSREEIVLEAETIVSLSFLGSTPVRWRAWLRRGVDGALIPILRYNVSYGSDTGFSYTTTERRFSSLGHGLADTVRLDTHYTVDSPDGSFRNTAVSFCVWNGHEFHRDVLDDLPRIGSVVSDEAALHLQPRQDSRMVAALARGDQLYLFDRSDTRQFPDQPRSWWYRGVTRSGAEGWVLGTSVDLTWVDPLKVNRQRFLRQAEPSGPSGPSGHS